MGAWEIALIAVIALLFFGPDKIPQMLKTVKKGIGFYTDARDQVQEVVSTQIISPEELEALKDPLGLGGKSKGALLTPERKSLYTQAESAPVAEKSTPQSSSTEVISAAPAQGINASHEVPVVQEISSVASPQSSAESIWASLEQPAPKPAPESAAVEGKD